MEYQNDHALKYSPSFSLKDIRHKKEMEEMQMNLKSTEELLAHFQIKYDEREIEMNKLKSTSSVSYNCWSF